MQRLFPEENEELVGNKDNLVGAAGHFDRILDGVDKAQLVAVALAGVVEVGAVVHTGADDGQTQRDVDALYGLPLLLFAVVDKAHGLERDVALIVVHAHHDVVPAADGPARTRCPAGRGPRRR